MTLSEEDASFEAWWKKVCEDDLFDLSAYYPAQVAWNAATLAERERCLDVCARVESEVDGRCRIPPSAEDAVLEVADAIRNP